MPMHCSPLHEDICPLLMPKGTPKVLSCGMRCVELGYGFWWAPYSLEPEIWIPIAGSPGEFKFKNVWLRHTSRMLFQGPRLSQPFQEGWSQRWLLHRQRNQKGANRLRYPVLTCLHRQSHIVTTMLLSLLCVNHILSLVERI